MIGRLAATLAVSGAPARAQDFPQTFEHRFGTTTVEAAPERVVLLDYGGQDDLLTLGVVPVGQRFWYGDHPLGTWPWARDALGAARFELLKGEINVEQVAALDPDLILAVYSGLSEEEYVLLSQVAPVIATEAAYDEFGTPWNVRVRTVGRAAGHAAEAIDAAAVEGSFYATLSAEDLSPLDVDLLVWADDAGSLAPAVGTPLRRGLRAHREGREVYAGDLLFGALTFNSLLSLPFALDGLVPQIEAAMDGDPTTPVPEAVAAGLAPTASE